MATTKVATVWTSVDYQLDWPAELLSTELILLMDQPYREWTGTEVELLLCEAFHTEVPAADFARLHGVAEWANDPAPTRAWINDLLDHVAQLRPYAPPRPYWAGRQGRSPLPAQPDAAVVPHRFAELIGHLRAH